MGEVNCELQIANNELENEEAGERASGISREGLRLRVRLGLGLRGEGLTGEKFFQQPFYILTGDGFGVGFG